MAFLVFQGHIFLVIFLQAPWLHPRVFPKRKQLSQSFSSQLRARVAAGGGLSNMLLLSLATSNSGDCCRRKKSFPHVVVFCFLLYLVWWAVEFVVVAKQMAFYFISHISAPSCFVCLRAASCCCWLVLSLHLWLKLGL